MIAPISGIARSWWSEQWATIAIARSDASWGGDHI
jgi:hypothetical protein